MTPDEAVLILEAEADPQKAEEMAAFHKIARPYLGIPVHRIDALAREWRQSLSLEDRLTLAASLWHLGIHETMIAGAKLLEQARIRPDDSAAWDLVKIWAEGFEGVVVSDHASVAGQKRLVADPSRVADLAAWTGHANLWTRRAVLVMTQPWAKMNFPKAQDLEIREQALAWAATLAEERNWFMQKAVAGWVQDLSRHDAARAAQFMAEHGDKLKGFARKEASRYLTS